jgi:outer membrane protein TolC
MGTFLAIAIAMLSLGAAPRQTGPMTLAQAIGIALQNSFSVHRAESAIAKTRGQVNEGYGRMRPTVSGSLTYTRYDEASTASFPGHDSQGNSITQSIMIQPISTRTATLLLTQPVDIAGLQRIGVHAAKAVEAASRQGLVAQTSVIAQNTKLAFFDVLRTSSAVEIAETALKNSEERQRLAEAQVTAGSASKIDVLRAKTQVAQNTQLVTGAKHTVELAKAAFNDVLGRDVSLPVELVAVKDLPPVGKSLEQLTQKAIGTRSEIAQLASLVKANQDAVRLQQRGNWPAFNLSVPIYQGGITKARVDQAKADLETAKTNLDEAKLGVTLEVKQALTLVLDAGERLNTAEAALAEAEEALRLAQLRYKNGIAIELEVSDAELALTQAQTNALNARYDYLQAYSRLQKAVGSEEL